MWPDNFRCGILVIAGILIFVSACEQREAYRTLDRAYVYEVAGDETHAIEAYALAAQIAPGDAYLQRALARAHLRRQEFDLAREYLERAILLEPAYLDAYQDLIRVSVAQDDLDAALSWLEKAALAVPDYVPLYEELVSLYLASDRVDEADLLLQDLVQKFPDEAWVHYYQGNVLRIKERPQDALDACAHAALLDDLLPGLWAEIGNLHYDLAAFGAAEDAYSRAIEQDPRDHRSLNNLAWVYAERGRDIDRGIELSRASLELREEPSYMDTLAELYYKQGDRKRALIWIRRAIRAGSWSPELKEHLEQQYERFQRAPYGRT
jgi:tetratricopeptide (TPR) repeat protein